MQKYENGPEKQCFAAEVGNGGAERKTRGRGSRIITTETPPERAGVPCTLTELVFGPCLREERTLLDPSTGVAHVFLRSASTSAVCPFCGTESSEFHGWSGRNPRLQGLGGRRVQAHLEVRRYRCGNPSCAHGTFTEESPTVARYRHMFDFCYVLAFTIGSFLSASGTEVVMRLLGVPFSDDAVRGLMSRVRKGDDLDVDEVGVDDVCCRRGMSYYTIVYDARTHVPLAILPGRSGEALKVWLSRHTRIARVSRDRASSLAKAIGEVLPACVQVADRFHLFANVLECIKEVFRAEFPETVWYADGEVTDREPKRIRVPLFPAGCPEAEGIDVDWSPPCDKEGNPVRIDASTPRDAEEEAAVASGRMRKMLAAKRVRERWEEIDAEPLTDRSKSLLLGKAVRDEHMTLRMARKYLAMGDAEVEAIGRPGERDGLSAGSGKVGNAIYRMLEAGYHPGVIHACISGKGTGLSGSTIEKYIVNIARNNFGKKFGWWSFARYVYPDGVETLARGEILKYLTIKDKKLMENSPVAKHYPELCERFPIVANAAEIWNDWGAIFEDKDTEKLTDFLEKYEFSMVTKFVDGVMMDLAPVMNAVTEPDNSGFVEGGNSAFQLDKRMTGGRASPELMLNRRYVQATLRRNLSPLSALFRDYHRVSYFPDLEKRNNDAS
ncbi:MAG: ISL3 family transposase [Bacteroidales bacterium]|nr:ISL3 family transposase [Bacteroidales bacterium]